MQVAVLIFIQLYFVPFLKGQLRMGPIQEIKSIFIVNLQVRSVDLELSFMLAHCNLLKQKRKDPWDYSPILPSLPSTHCVSFPWASLAIGKYRAVVPLKTVKYNWLSYILKHFLLSDFLIKHFGELENETFSDVVDKAMSGIFGLDKFKDLFGGI